MRLRYGARALLACALACAVAGCGRLGFQPPGGSGHDDDDHGGDDGPSPGSELCNGLDDDGDGATDEGACAADCTGIERLGRGYMLCTTSVTWVQAEARCKAAGLQMLRVDDAAENDFIRSLVDPLPNPQVWLGATDAAVEGVWRWPDGAQFWQGSQTGSPVGGLFSAWTSSEPDDRQNSEDCAESVPMALWIDQPCASAALDVVMCEQP